MEDKFFCYYIAQSKGYKNSGWEIVPRTKDCYLYDLVRVEKEGTYEEVLRFVEFQIEISKIDSSEE